MYSNFLKLLDKWAGYCLPNLKSSKSKASRIGAATEAQMLCIRCKERELDPRLCFGVCPQCFCEEWFGVTLETVMCYFGETAKPSRRDMCRMFYTYDLDQQIIADMHRKYGTS